MSSVDEILVRKINDEHDGSMFRFSDYGVETAMLTPEARSAVSFIETHKKEHGSKPSDEILVYEMGWNEIPLSEFDAEPGYLAKEIKIRYITDKMISGMDDVQKTIKGGKSETFEAKAKLIALADELRSVSSSRKTAYSMFSLFPKVAENYRRYKEGQVGFETPFPTVTDAIQGYQLGDAVCWVARPGTGKCVAMDTKVMCADGVPREIWRMLEGEGDQVVCWNEKEGTFEARNIDQRIDSGVKKVFRVRTRLGREVKVTACHPFLTVNGWVKLEDGLGVGDHIASPRLQNFFGTRCHPDEAVVIAGLLTEGNTTRNEIGFTNLDPDIIEVMSEAVSSYGTELIQRPSSRECEYHIVDRDRPDNRLLDLVSQWGMKGCKAENKIIPEVVYTYDRDTLGLFLRMAFSCDGSRTGRGVEYCSASEELSRGIQTLLLRFGVVAKLRFKANAHQGAWILDMYGKDAQKFVREIGFIGDKARRLGGWESNVGNSNLDHIPKFDRLYDVYDSLTGEQVAQGKAILESMGLDGSRFILSRFKRYKMFPRDLTKVLAEVTSDEHLKMVTSDELIWDEILDVQDCGYERVADLGIEGEWTHNFVANDLIVHNTWVLLLHALKFHSQGYRVLMVQPELTGDQLAERFACLHLEVSYPNMIKGRMDAFREVSFLNSLENGTYENNMWVLEDNMEFDRADVEYAIEQYDPDIVLMDSMYLLGSGRSRSEQVENASPWIKKIAKSSGRSRLVVATSQMNRDACSPEKMTPNNIFGSDAIYQDFDLIYGMYQDDDMYRDKLMGYYLFKMRRGTKHPPFNAKFSIDDMDFTEIGSGDESPVDYSAEDREAFNNDFGWSEEVSY